MEYDVEIDGIRFDELSDKRRAYLYDRYRKERAELGLGGGSLSDFMLWCKEGEYLYEV